MRVPKIMEVRLGRGVQDVTHHRRQIVLGVLVKSVFVVLGPCRTERAPPLSDHSCLRDAARPAAPRDPPIKGRDRESETQPSQGSAGDPLNLTMELPARLL